MAEIKERLKKNGKKSYTASIRIKGYPALTATFDRLTDARLWVNDNESKMRKGKHITEVEAKKHTLADLIERYIANELKRRNTDQQKFEMQLNWWKKEIGAYLLSGITPVLIGEYRDKLQKEPYKYIKSKNESEKPKPVYRSDATINRYMAALSIAFTVACNEWGWIEENPMRRVKKRTEPRGRVRFLSEEEQKALLEACQKAKCPYLYIVVVVALSTGARFSEVMTLRWQDVDFDKSVLKFMETKNGENRPVPLSAYAYEVLLKHSKVRKINSSYVFPRRDGKAPLELRKRWDKAVKESGIVDFKFHDLRHTAASNLAMSGATLTDLSHILGHKTLQMVKRYAHLTEQHTAKILEKMNDKQFKDISNV